MQRRIEQPDRHRQPAHRFEDPLEVLLLQRQQLASAARRPSLVLGHDHRPHLRLALLGHEHVLGPAQADSLGAELARARGVRGVSALARTPSRRSSSAHPSTVLEVLVDRRRRPAARRRSTTAPSLPSIADQVPGVQDAIRRSAARRRRTSIVTAAPVTAGHAHPPRHQRRVRGLAALRGQDRPWRRGSRRRPRPR